MVEQNPLDEKELERIKQEYREIRLPDAVATRIQAQSRTHRTAAYGWRYALAVSALLIGVLILLPEDNQSFVPQPASESVSALATPTLARINHEMPAKPLPVPGFSSLKSYNLPAVPGVFRLHSIPKS